MRAKIATICVVVVVLGLAGSARANLLAHYTFDDSTANDSSGYHHHGTLVGSANIIYEVGQWNKDPNYVLYVGGSQDYGYVNCGGGNGGWGDFFFGPCSFPPEVSKVTIAAWYKPIGLGNNFDTVVSKGYGETDGWALNQYWNNSDIAFQCRSNPDWKGLPSTNPNSWDNQWHHVVGVYVSEGWDYPPDYSPGFSKIYIDGELWNSSEKWGCPGNNEWDIIIGGNDQCITGSGQPGWRAFNGLVDDVRIYDEALDADQVVNIYMGNPPDIALTINIEPSDVNTVTPSAGEHLYFPNQSVHLIADDFVDCPDVYKFDHWVGDVSDVNAPDTLIVMTEDKTVTAMFVDTRECGDQCHPILAGDLNFDCYINFEDFAIYCAQWLSCTHPDCDF